MTTTANPAFATETRRERILVVDDDRGIHRLLRAAFGGDGYQMIEASDVSTAIRMLEAKPDLVVIELEIPDMQGTQLLQTIRAHIDSVPIVILSRCRDESDKVRALELGAHDFITKPFGMGEFLARIRAALRHGMPMRRERPVFRTGRLCVDLDNRMVKVAGATIKLSSNQHDLLGLLVRHAGKVLTHGFLLDELWGQPVGRHRLRVCVRQLRQKIEINTAEPQYIFTRPGIGYRLRAPDTQPQEF
jgi:two-component system, OmpR family, KDP operon response regulator KdpE